jgi:hypothetical protein
LSLELTPEESLKIGIIWRIIWEQCTIYPLPLRSLETSPFHLAFNVLVLCQDAFHVSDLSATRHATGHRGINPGRTSR